MGRSKISRKELILEGDMYKALMTLAIPIMINNLIQTLYNFADALWVSELGSTEFAATSFVWPVNFLFISIGLGISIASTSILSQLYGGGKEKEAREYASQIVVISSIVSLIFTVIGYFITPYVVRWMGATGELAIYSTIYLKITFLDMPFMFLFNNFNSIMTAEGNTVTPTILSAISGILNAILDPIFIFTFNFGIAGAAIATVISKALLAFSGILVIKYKDVAIKPSFKDFKFDKDKIRTIFKIGLPSSIGQSGSAFGFIFLNKFIVSYGTATMAAYGMVNRITSLVMQPIGGVGSALTTISGQNIGANKLDRAKEAFKKASIFVIVIGLIGCGIMLIFDEQIIGIFMSSKKTPDLEVIEQGLEYLQYAAWFTPLMGMFNIYQGIFQGSGHTKYSMYMTIGRLWFVRLPMILFFREFTNLGPTGIWIAMSASNLIVCIYGQYIYSSGKWERPVVESKAKK